MCTLCTLDSRKAIAHYGDISAIIILIIISGVDEIVVLNYFTNVVAFR